MGKKSFFELLKLNRLAEVKNQLLLRGKSPKAVCPILFLDDESVEQKKECKDDGK